MLYGSMQAAYFLNVPNLEAYTLSEEDKDGLTFWKELIYQGDFYKGKQHIPVDIPLLHHWNQTAERMLSNGVEIPVPSEHNELPEARRGSLIGTKVQKNIRGIPSLYGKIQFKDTESAKLAATTNVSIFADTEFQDGKGNNYFYPIRHVALTDYPVIPGLEKFQAIAASFSDKGLSKMAIDPRELAKKLGVAE